MLRLKHLEILTGDWFSTSELDIRTAPTDGAESGISLINKRNTCSNQWPVNHEQIVQCVDTEAMSEAGWYGESTVNAVNHDENIHGNDDFYTSYYEGYFYVDSILPVHGISALIPMMPLNWSSTIRL